MHPAAPTSDAALVIRYFGSKEKLFAGVVRDMCDRIMVVLDGRIEGFDTPERLEASNPFYREALELSGLR